MGTAAINPDRQVQADQSELKKVPLSSRLIHPFKAIINQIKFYAAYSVYIGAAIGFITFGAVGLAAGVAGGIVGGVLGCLIKLAKMVAGCPSEAHYRGFQLGALCAALIASLPGMTVATAVASLAAFGVIASVGTAINLPANLFHAATWTRTEMDEWAQKIDNDWQAIKDDMQRLADNFNPAS